MGFHLVLVTSRTSYSRQGQCEKCGVILISYRKERDEETLEAWTRWKQPRSSEYVINELAL